MKNNVLNEIIKPKHNRSERIDKLNHSYKENILMSDNDLIDDLIEEEPEESIPEPVITPTNKKVQVKSTKEKFDLIFNKIIDIHNNILGLYEDSLYDNWDADTIDIFNNYMDEYNFYIDQLNELIPKIEWKSIEARKEFLTGYYKVLKEDNTVFNLIKVRHEYYLIYRTNRKSLILQLCERLGLVKAKSGKNNLEVFIFLNNNLSSIPLQDKNGNTLKNYFSNNVNKLVKQINESNSIESHYDKQEVQKIFQQYEHCRKMVFAIFNMITSSSEINGYKKWKNIIDSYCNADVKDTQLERLYNAANTESFEDIDDYHQVTDDKSWHAKGIYEKLNYNKPISIPSILYHTENPYNRDLVYKRGLVPSIGGSYECHYEDEELDPVIFLSEHKYDSTYDDDIWEIDVTQLDESCIFNDFDDTMEGCYVYTKRIKPEALTLVYEGNETFDRASEDWYKDINESWFDEDLLYYNNRLKEKCHKEDVKKINAIPTNANICKVVTDGKAVYSATTFYPNDIVEICPTKNIDKSSLYSNDMRELVFEVVPNKEWVFPFGYCKYYSEPNIIEKANCTYIWDPIQRVIVIKALTKIPKYSRLILNTI